MFKLRNRNEKFKPSQAVLKGWLYTPKDARTYGYVELPGLFHTHNIEIRIIGFCVLILLEVAGMLSAVLLFGQTFYIPLAFLLLDISFAIASHGKHNKLCLLRSQMKIAKDTHDPTSPVPTRSEIDRQVNSIKRYELWMSIIIAAIAGAKIFAYYYASMVFDWIDIPIVVGYLVIAFLQITCTGYVIYSLYYNVRFNRQQTKLYQGVQEYVPAVVNEERIDLHENFEEKTFFNRYGIRKKGDDYYVWAEGILPDEDLVNIIYTASDDARQTAIALAGLRIQLSQL